MTATGSDSGTGVRASRYDRLSPTDLMFLRLETAEWPCHFGGLVIVDGKPLLDDAGRLRLNEIKEGLADRISHLPDLRQRVHHPGLFGGRPLWVDDPEFHIDNHVFVADSRGGAAGLHDTATDVYEQRLDRRRPLWELWFLVGRTDDRIGVLLKLHHAVADGLAAVAIMGALFDLEPAAAGPARAPWTPAPIPSRRELVADNLASKVGVVQGILRTARVSRLPDSLRSFARMTRGFFGADAAPAGSLNRIVGRGREVRSLPLDLATMKAVAGAHDGKINDVVLTLWAGGLRDLLRSRGEPVTNVELITGMATTLRPSTGPGESIDNRVGTMVLRLPLGEPDADRRLAGVIDRTRKAKAEWSPAATMGYLAGLAGTPLGHYFVAHQKASNTIVTNVMGPPAPVYLLGARVLEIVPIIELVGNIGLTLCAFSYTGTMLMVVTADAAGFPDLEVLMTGMEREWRELTG